MKSPPQLIRPLVRRLHPYVPGEQPKIKGLIKLNTNENPYPPSPKVLRAIKDAVDGRLRLYPNPSAERLRTKLAALHRCRPEDIIVGNGSDELLAMAVRAFVEPASSSHSRIQSRSVVQYFHPSYSLYPVLAEIHGAVSNPIPLKENYDLPTADDLRRLARKRTSRHRWDFRAALTFVTTPNAPSGRGYSVAQLSALCRRQKGIVILDEAYVDFAKENAMALALKYPNVLVARTFSKAYSLCFQRVGYFVGHPDLIAALQKIRDSYNVNGIGQIAAEATLDNLQYYRRNFGRIIETRDRLTRQLTRLGFTVRPSQTNFLFAVTPIWPAKRWLVELRARKILVRWFSQPGISSHLRITIGTPNEAAALVRAVKGILASKP